LPGLLELEAQTLTLPESQYELTALVDDRSRLSYVEQETSVTSDTTSRSPARRHVSPNPARQRRSSFRRV
jgi:hypothetical protein